MKKPTLKRLSIINPSWEQAHSLIKGLLCQSCFTDGDKIRLNYKRRDNGEWMTVIFTRAYAITQGRLGCTGYWMSAVVNTHWSPMGSWASAEPARGWAYYKSSKSKNTKVMNWLRCYLSMPSELGMSHLIEHPGLSVEIEVLTKKPLHELTIDELATFPGLSELKSKYNPSRPGNGIFIKGLRGVMA